MSSSNTPEPKDIQDFAISFAIASQLHGSWMQDTLGRFGLTVAQLSVLSHLSRLPPDAAVQRISDIARAVDVNQPGVTKMMAKFETQGWVTVSQDSGDKRAKKVAITKAGRDQLMDIQLRLFPGFNSWFADWSPSELQAFSANLRRFAKAMAQPTEPPPTP